MWGVGPVTARALHDRGYRTFGDIQRAGERQLVADFAESGPHWWRLAHGVDDRPVETGRAAKSVGEEETFAEDLATVGEV